MWTFTMNNNKREQIQSLADTVREHLSYSTPFDVEKAVLDLGGIIENFNEQYGQDADAYIRKYHDTFAIAVKNTSTEKRKRFSIAHELGHLFLHMGYLIDDDLWNSVDTYVDSVWHRMGYNEEEFEAHEFAASLLMPEEEFIKISKDNFSDGYYSLDKIAEHFNVSNKAAKVRGCWLGIFSWD